MKKIIFGINLILPPSVAGSAQNQKNSSRFEKIEGNNLSAPISATNIGITRATADSNIGDSSDSDISGRPGSSRSVSSGSGSDGLLGGVGNAVGGVVNATTPTVGRVTGTAGKLPVGAARTLGRMTGGIRISALTGVSAAGSTTLSTAGDNPQLEKVAGFQLRRGGSAQNQRHAGCWN